MELDCEKKGCEIRKLTLEIANLHSKNDVIAAKSEGQRLLQQQLDDSPEDSGIRELFSEGVGQAMIVPACNALAEKAAGLKMGSTDFRNEATELLAQSALLLALGAPDDIAKPCVVQLRNLYEAGFDGGLDCLRLIELVKVDPSQDFSKFLKNEIHIASNFKEDTGPVQ
jgi:hypothetical protein